MKKLIKPRKDVSRAHFIAGGGSTETLNQPTPPQEEPQQGPVPNPTRVILGPFPLIPSPSPLRKVTSSHSMLQGDGRALSSSRRPRVSSRYGGGASQSFSPGDLRPSPRDRFRRRAAGVWGTVEEDSSDPGDDSRAVSEDSPGSACNEDPPSASMEDLRSSLGKGKTPLSEKSSL
ncbi:UNVERIFIED_CONTAM: hypothetical protein FKN15_009570 [Acipenser sinensis]